MVVVAAVMLGVLLPQAGLADAPAVSSSPVRVEAAGDPTPIETLRLAILTVAVSKRG